MSRVLCLAAAWLSVVAVRPTPQAAGPCQFDAVCRFLEQNIGVTRPPVTLAGLRSFARVERERASRVKNLHDPSVTDEVHDFEYAGVTVKAYASTAGPVLIQEIVLTTNHYPLPLGLALGKSTLDDVQYAMGWPKTVKHLSDGTSTWVYENVERTASFVFTFEPEPSMAIRSVQWLFDVD